mmetsp:Transcript_8479/g.11171  ORF Transcript_8479/g.11171 Transcript_8479/m.11171 type:complete len:126 (+) Transcript_8479:350-727(+)
MWKFPLINVFLAVDETTDSESSTSRLPCLNLMLFACLTGQIPVGAGGIAVSTESTLAGLQQAVSHTDMQTSDTPVAIFPNLRARRSDQRSLWEAPSIFSAVNLSTSKDISEAVEAVDGQDSSSCD